MKRGNRSWVSLQEQCSRQIGQQMQMFWDQNILGQLKNEQKANVVSVHEWDRVDLFIQLGISTWMLGRHPQWREASKWDWEGEATEVGRKPGDCEHLEKSLSKCGGDHLCQMLLGGQVNEHWKTSAALTEYRWKYLKEWFLWRRRHGHLAAVDWIKNERWETGDIEFRQAFWGASLKRKTEMGKFL